MSLYKRIGVSAWRRDGELRSALAPLFWHAGTILILLAGVTLFGQTSSTRLARYMSLTYAVIACLGLQLTRASLPAGLFLIWTAIVFWVHPMTPILAALTAVIYGGGLLLIARSSFPRQRIYNAVCCYAIANVCWQALQIWGLTFGYRPIFEGAYTLVGLQTNVGETSALMAISLPAFFRRRWAWLIPIPLAGLFMAQATVGVLACAVMGVVYLLTRVAEYRRVGVAAIVTIIIAMAAYMTFADRFDFDNFKHSRLQTWKESTAIALDRPALGWGFGQFCAVVPLLSTPVQLGIDDRLRLYDEVENKAAFGRTARKITGGDAAAYYTAKKYPERLYFEAHNEYIEVLFAAGIPGVVLLLTALVSLLWKGWRGEERVGVSEYRRIGAEDRIGVSAYRSIGVEDRIGVSAYRRIGDRAFESFTPSPRHAVTPSRDLIPFFGLLASCVCATIWFVWQIVPVAVVTLVWAGLCLEGNQPGAGDGET